MTVDTTGAAVAPYKEPDLDNAGLEDLDNEDIRIPRLKIVGKNATFKDTITQEEFPELDFIILGMVKQRIMWDKDVDDNERPLCKSPDFVTGFPTVAADVPADKRFPWADSNFDPATFNRYSADPAHNGHVVLPCASCKFKEWKGKNPPPCAEGYAYSLLYGEPGQEPTMPAILTLQRSGLGAGKTYNSFFAAQKIPFFSFKTHASLVAKQRGSVDYATPILRRGEGTDQGMWDFYATQARAIRELLRQPPRPPEGYEAPEPSVNANVAPAPAAAPVPAPAPVATAPVPAPAPAPPQPAAPAPAPAAAPPAPAPAPVVEAPAAPAPVAPPAPPQPAPVTPPPAPAVAPPAPPAPAVQPAAPAAAATAVADDEDDDLPF